MGDYWGIAPVTPHVSSLIEVIPFSIEDFTEENPLASEIIKTGIQIV